MLMSSTAFAILFACWCGGSTTTGFRKPSNFFYVPGFRTGGPLGPQRNVDGLWTFIAVPVPLENQTLPEGDFPMEQVAQAKLWGPVYRPGHGWVYGEAGFVFVPRMPPYVPPIIFPPPRSLSNGDVTPASVAAVSERDVDSVVEPVINALAASAPADSAVTTEKEPMKADEEKYDENKNNVNTKEP